MKRLVGAFEYFADEGKMYFFKINEQGCIVDNDNKVTLYPVNEYPIGNWFDVATIIRNTCAEIILNTQINEIEQVHIYEDLLHKTTIKLIGE